MTKIPLVLCSLVTAIVGVAGCRSGQTRVVPGTRLTIDFELPHDKPESLGAGFCPGAQSIVLAIDEHGTGFSHVLLLDATERRLYGCGGQDQACPVGRTIEHSFSSPQRILAEWVDVAPELYSTTSSNVICRGMFDLASNLGDLREATGPDGEEQFTVTIPLLRVGAMNGYFSYIEGNDQPYGSFMGLAPLTAPEDLPAGRTTDGGKILAAGGWVTSGMAAYASTGLFVFEADDLAFQRVATAVLPEGRAALSATPFEVGASSFVLLAGGAGNDPSRRTDTWLFTGEEAGTLLPGPPMFTPRAHHSAVGLPTILAGTDSRRGIVMVRGCDFDGTDPTSEPAEFFSAGPPPSTAQCGPTSNGVLFCRMPGTPQPAYCQSSATPMERTDLAAETVLWIGGGGAAGQPNETDSLDLEENLTSVHLRLPVSPGLRGAAVVEAGPNASFLVGGDAANFGAPPDPQSSVLLVSSTGGPPALTATLREPRAFGTATRLLDERILVTGGRTSGGASATYELGAMVVGPALVFEYESCLPEAESCSGMIQGRAEHGAVMVRGSTTWLNGSVVIAGGGNGTILAPPEIYVPAYACDAMGTLPVTVTAGTPAVVAGVDFCDRGRAPLLPIMDPSDPE